MEQETMVNGQLSMLNEESPSFERVSQKLRIALLAHFEKGVAIGRLNVRREHRDMIARVDHVYWLLKKDPMLDTHAFFYELAKADKNSGGADNRGNAHNRATFEDKLLEFVLDNLKPPSRKRSEMKVRAAADRMIKIGMDTDNVAALDKGSKRLMEIDRLDQPESEQADMNRAAFLQPVVVTQASLIDESKIDYDDKQSLEIMQEFGAFIDPKRKMVEEKVAMMEARSGGAVEEAAGASKETENTEE